MPSMHRVASHYPLVETGRSSWLQVRGTPMESDAHAEASTVPSRHLVAMTWIVMAACVAAVAIDLAGARLDAAAAPRAAASAPHHQANAIEALSPQF
ncbi:hypothetical protein [Piscinibacter sp.]|jgi:hypothetical protein|uniref:hypothetical protein n=1 Tax=Piscinibacter sp. TaxID=1903157 RepID=UPI00355A4E08